MKEFLRRLFRQPPSPWSQRQWAIFLLLFLLGILGNGMGQILLREDRSDLCAGDHLAFYTASFMAQQGRAEQIYIPEEYMAQQGKLCDQGKGFFFWVYNPTALLLVYPMAWLGLIESYLLYGFLGLASMVVGLRYFLQREFSVLAPFVLACPAWLFTVNMGHALPLLLMGAVWAGFGALDRRRSLLAGFCFGLLILKPQYGLLLPVLLAGRREWRAFFATGGWALFFCVLSAALLGTASWQAFLQAGAVTAELLETTAYEPMRAVKNLTRAVITPFELIRQTGLGLRYVWIIYALSLLAAGAWLWRSARRENAAVARMVFCMTTLLASPWMHVYDLVWLSAMLVFLLQALPLYAGPLRQRAILWFLLVWPLLVGLAPLPRDLSLGAVLYLLPPWLACLYVQRQSRFCHLGTQKD